MTSVSEKLKDASSAAAARYALERGDVARFHRRRRRRAVLKASGIAAVFAVGLGTALGVLWRGSQNPLQRQVLADGSELVAEIDARYSVVTQDSSRVVVQVDAGRVSFRVASDRSRAFLVRAQFLEVEVTGTRFSVTNDSMGAVVTVTEGTVIARDLARREERTLSAGLSHRVPATPTAREDTESSEARAAPDEPPASTNPRPPRATPSGIKKKSKSTRRAARAMRQWVAQGDFRRAYEELERLGPAATEADEETLLAAVDAARLSGHERRAAELLQLFLQRFPDSREYRNAAFMLGDLYRRKLDSPRRAASSFQAAYERSRGFSLEEDALGYWAIALFESAQTSRAREVARRYLERYQDGSHAETLRALLRETP
ncbi:MAG: FecR domain-containing protein [Myxococcota bacterium]